MKRFYGVAAGLCVLVLTGWSLAVPTADEFQKAIAGDIEAIETGLGKATLDKKTKGKVKLAAVLLAAAAGENAALRDAALQLADAAEAGKSAEAKKLLDGIKGGLKGGKGGKVDWAKHLDFDGVMHAFSSERFGGFGLEKQLDEASELKGAVDAETAGKLIFLATQTHLVAELAPAYAPEKDEGSKTKKAWNGFAEEMKVAAGDFAVAARSKNGDNVAKAAQKLTQSCIRCHDVFR